MLGTDEAERSGEYRSWGDESVSGDCSGLLHKLASSAVDEGMLLCEGETTSAVVVDGAARSNAGTGTLDTLFLGTELCIALVSV